MDGLAEVIWNPFPTVLAKTSLENPTQSEPTDRFAGCALTHIVPLLYPFPVSSLTSTNPPFRSLPREDPNMRSFLNGTPLWTTMSESWSHPLKALELMTSSMPYVSMAFRPVHP